ncbi:RNA polymerase sigma factor [Clostridium minihomine]|uniref:RNA polymerase sigma factor n=1 Tax=Clostridium minihomine TaxID=2045012 RepID=UPI000C790AF7|nr:RNA polymerase sigma factor [Clostridium minihomine]
MQELEENSLSQKFDLYGSSLFRLCMVILCNQQDAEDSVQDTFVQYWKKHPQFQNEEHEKAWFIRVATNKSKDRLRGWFRRSTVSMDALEGIAERPQDHFVLEQLMSLPYKDKTILYLHYVEGYKLKEIGIILKMNENAVKAAARRGREKLKIQLLKEAAAE